MTRLTSSPDLAFLLLVGGILAIYCEFVFPGKVLPGVLGSTAALFSVSALRAFPLDWRGIALLALAFSLMVAAAFPSLRGPAGCAAAVCMSAGSHLLIEPASPRAGIHWATAVGAGIPFTIVSIFLFSQAVRARRNKSDKWEKPGNDILNS